MYTFVGPRNCIKNKEAISGQLEKSAKRFCKHVFDQVKGQETKTPSCRQGEHRFSRRNVVTKCGVRSVA